MRSATESTEFEKCMPVPIAAPSPLVGEGIAAGQRKRGWVRGFRRHITLRKQPLTRRDTHCVRVAPPSPTRGEGKKRMTHAWQAA
jgi:hypothetical protein